MADRQLDSLHQLVGAGRSRLSIVGAMRAREVSRPTPSHLDDAEARAPGVIAARLGGRQRWGSPERVAPDQSGSGGSAPVRS